MFQQVQQVSFTLPSWLLPFAQSYQPTLDLSERMRFVLAAAQQNIVEKTGGPFAAAIFNAETGALVSLGVNLVTTQNLSILHAEMVAIMLAQRQWQHYDLGATGLPAHELFTSTEPCAMCFGAIPWSGLRRVVCAAADSDARMIGFDEGPKLPAWSMALQQRGIAVLTDIEREAGQAVLLAYQQAEGHIYNSREN